MIQERSFNGVDSNNTLNAVMTQITMSQETAAISPPPSELKRPKVVAGIPAYNEAQFIGDIVDKCSRFVDEVIVVDDGSTDCTAQVAEAAGAMVIRHETNRGAGAATESCFQAARQRNADVLITLDGDGQHDPDEIPQVAVPALLGEADLVIGSRFIADNSRMPAYRKFGINIITWLCNLGSKVPINDTQSCFRAYGKRAISTLNSTDQGFGFSVDLLIQSRENDLIITEVPISCIYHSASHSANPINHGLSVAFAVIKFRLKNRWSRTNQYSVHGSVKEDFNWSQHETI